ncbi:MAG TPA: hypothetical protein VLM38_10215 [Blastocatellia bacterium]|nr:hypothetical protein [Blastocatellia bacterium]
MKISRRKFLGRGSLVSVAALFTINVRARANSGSSTAVASGLDRLRHLTNESFAANLNTTFEVHVSALNTQQLELISVSARTRSGQYETFDLFFAGKDTPFSQGTYLIQNRMLGSFPLFVVPMGGGENGTLYQAVFARLR